MEPEHWRAGLDDNVPIVFTHNDLNRSNILVSWDKDGLTRVVGLIDWHQSGWYPAPWEFYKTRLTAKGDDAWELEFIVEFLQSYRGYVSWEYYIDRLGKLSRP